MKTEVWKDIKGYEGLYQVSSCGRVQRTTKTITTPLFLVLLTLISLHTLTKLR